MTLEEYIAQQNALAGGLPPPAPALQPGLSVPTSTIDPLVQPASVEPVEIEMPGEAVVRPQEIEMPGEVVTRPPVIGAPRVPELGAASMPDDEVAAQRAKIDAQLAAPQGPVLGTMQPGLGVPATVVDQLAPSPMHSVQAAAQLATTNQQLSPASAPAAAAVPQPTGEPVPAVDAISGVDARPPAGTQLDRVEHTGGYAAALSREPTEEEQIAGLSWMAERDPAAYMALRAKQAHAIEMERVAGKERIAAEEARRAAEDNRRFKEDYARAQKYADELDADARREATREVDPNRWWHDASTGQTITGIIIAALGGLTQHLNGGRNLGLEAINRSIDRDIAAQVENMNNRRANLQTRRGLVADLFERTGNLERAAETARIAGRVHALNLYEAQMHRFELGGMRRFQIAEDIAKQKAELALMNARNAEADMKRQEAERKAELEQKEFEEKARHNKAQEAADRTRAGADWIRAKSQAEKDKAERDAMKAENTPMSVEELRRLYPSAPAEAFAIGPTSIKRFNQHLETFAKGAAVTKGVEDAAKAAREGTAGDLVDTNDKPLRFPSPELGARIVKKRGAVDNGTRIVDQMLVMINEHGWSPDLTRSDEWLAAQSDAQQLYIQLKNDAELGVLAGPDMGILEKMTGGDPTQVRDPSAALRQLRSNLVNNLNGDIKASAAPGQVPKRYEPPKIEPAQALERTKAQNSDVWSSELINSPDEKVRARAAQRAVDSIDAFSRQLEPSWIKVTAGEARDRRDRGIFTEEQYEKAMKPLRRQWERVIDEYDDDAKYRFGAPRKFDVRNFGYKTPEERKAQIDEQIFTPYREND